METLSYSYFVSCQDSMIDHRQCPFIFKSILWQKSTKAVLFALILILGLTSNLAIVNHISATETDPSTTTSTQSTVLKQGDRGVEVKMLQLRLKGLKFFNEELTDYFGEQTKDAVIKFQKAYGLNPDGVVGSGTQAKIKEVIEAENKKIETEATKPSNVSVLKVGSQGDEVKLLQQHLKDLKFFNDEVTGYFGNVTKQTVIDFQKTKNLTADGVAGSETLNAISNSLKGNSTTSTNTSTQPTQTKTTTPTTEDTLTKGMSGDVIISLQKQLTQIGAYDGPITGFFGPKTEEAVKKLQSKYELNPTGIVDGVTKGLIEQRLKDGVTKANPVSTTTSKAVLKRGSQGEAVRLLQEQLTQIGVYNGPITSFFGPQTEEAVKKFQTQNGIVADGIMGSSTQAALDAKIGKSNVSPNIVTTAFTSQEIANFQQKLQSLGYYQGKIDGIAGVSTSAALKKFQMEQNLAVTGIFDSATQRALIRNYQPLINQQAVVPPYTMSDQPSVQEIQLLQRRLQVAGLYKGKIDGVMGQEMKEALERARLAYGIASIN
jgi:peptidoglycan hydrolase-like protein with peptidoglycan-binding domain